MTDFRYTLAYERTYHDLGLVKPGDVHDLDEAPDGNWVPVQHRNKPEAPADGTTSKSKE